MKDTHLTGLWSNQDGPLIVRHDGQYIRLSDGIGWFESKNLIKALFPGEWTGYVSTTEDPNELVWSDGGGSWNRMRDLTGTWVDHNDKAVELAQNTTTKKVIGKGIHGMLNDQEVTLTTAQGNLAGQLSNNDRLINWTNGATWTRTPNCTGHWVVAQTQPAISNIPGTGVQAGTKVNLRQDENNVISSQITGVDSAFNVNGKLMPEKLTVTGNFPFGLGLGWLEHTSMSLQWHANRFNRIMDVTGQWLDEKENTITLEQTTPHPLKWPAVGTITSKEGQIGTIDRNWISLNGSDGICDLITQEIHFTNGEKWTRLPG